MLPHNQALNRVHSKTQKPVIALVGELNILIPMAGLIDKAPTDVIEKEKAKLADLRSTLNNLKQQKTKIQAL